MYEIKILKYRILYRLVASKLLKMLFWHCTIGLAPTKTKGENLKTQSKSSNASWLSRARLITSYCITANKTK